MISQNISGTSQLLVEAGKSIMFTAMRPEIVMERGEGLYLWDTEESGLQESDLIELEGQEYH